ncbi:MAG: class I SAM-dependent methyltransferase [Candidatus Limnocylindrales bacterium]|nr:class I SAM-dependent methyltransferase [Candidatus Limnocylindrales bacterium]
MRSPSGAKPAIAFAGRASPIDPTGFGRPDPATAAALARLYDLDLVDDPGDLDLYLALADRADVPILELAVGSGRLAVPLAGAGHLVTGVDLDPAMLDRAQSRARAGGPGLADRLTLIEADLVDLRLPTAGAFGLAFIALNSLLVLPTRAAQRAALRTLAEHLAPGGLAVVDIWIPDAEDLGRFDGRISLDWPRLDPETGAIVTKAGSAQHDAASATVTLTTIFEEGGQGVPARRWIRRDRLRLVSADELRGFAEEAGLAVELLAGDYGLGPIGPGSERAVLLAVKA